MSCTQKQQLVCFPKVRVYKPWFRHFNDHKDFRNEGTVHLFSLMALFSYANFRSNERVINGDRYMEEPGQWICKLGALPRILRVHSKTQALELMEYFQDHGFLTFEILDEEKEILRFTIADWKEHCTHLQYNYYSYKGSGFFFFPLPVGRLLLKTARKEVGIVFSELDAIMDMWLHTILNDPKVRGSEYMPVVYYSNMRGMPLLSYTYLARRWGWSKSRVGRFMLKAGEYGIISRVSFSSSRGSVISMCRYCEMIYGEGCEELELSSIGEIIGIAKAIDVVEAEDSEKDICIYINSPGGSVTAGMAIYDTMQYIKPDVSTICIGMAASMGAFLLSSGAKGKRFALPNAEIMIHQPLGGVNGQAEDIKIHAEWILKTREKLNRILAANTGQDLDTIEKDTDRDNFMGADEACRYGLIDQVITSR